MVGTRCWPSLSFYGSTWATPVVESYYLSVSRRVPACPLVTHPCGTGSVLSGYHPGRPVHEVGCVATNRPLLPPAERRAAWRRRHRTNGAQAGAAGGTPLARRRAYPGHACEVKTRGGTLAPAKAAIKAAGPIPGPTTVRRAGEPTHSRMPDTVACGLDGTEDTWRHRVQRQGHGRYSPAPPGTDRHVSNSVRTPLIPACATK